MQIIGELVDNYILVKKAKDVGRLYNKSCFGETLSGNILKLNLIEGIFLLDENKMKLFHEGTEISFSTLFKVASSHIPAFEIKYLAFRDIRKRGHMIQLYDEIPEVTFCSCNKKNENNCYIATFSERDTLNYQHIVDLIKSTSIKQGILWFAIVDEEGDITYYDVSSSDLSGQIKEKKYQNGTGILLDNRVVLFDKSLAIKLLKNEFFGKPFGEGLQISLVEALYLMGKGVLEIQTIKDGHNLSKKDFIKLIKKMQPDIELRILVFKDLKKRGLIVKTGFKFGAHFRAYTKDPTLTHAEYLIHIVDENFTCSCAELSRAVRLAHSVNKEIVFAQISKNTIEYIRFGRLRP